MRVEREPSAKQPSVGALLQQWRKTRHLSQLGLAVQASISSRHLCFVETGRASPSREMVMKLAGALDVPLRERNTLLLAAGFAPVYAESKLDAPALAAVRAALDAILAKQEPLPALVMNRRWDVMQTNEAARRFFGWLLGEGPPKTPRNVLRMMFHRDGVRRYVKNWNAVAESLVARVRREAIGGVPDQVTEALLAEVLAYPDVPEAIREASGHAPLSPVVPIAFEKDNQRFDFFSAVTTLGTPQDITVQEIRIECFFPANQATSLAITKRKRWIPAK